jgi:hypothetical protein
MSIINCDQDDFYGVAAGQPNEKRCFHCGGRLYAPFLHYAAKAHLCICLKCCRELKRGLTADLIHLSAIAELRDIGCGGETLTRKLRCNLEQRAEKQAAEARRIEAELSTRQPSAGTLSKH